MVHFLLQQYHTVYSVIISNAYYIYCISSFLINCRVLLDLHAISIEFISFHLNHNLLRAAAAE